MPRGRKPRPALQVIREGNPGHRKVADPVTLPPSALVEPAWAELLPGDSSDAKRVRLTASALWARTAPTHSRSMGLVAAQQDALVDYCVTRARIEQGERALSREGVVVSAGRADRGRVRNPWTTVLNQYRPHFRALAAELGLTPSAASRLNRPTGATDGDDDPFDS